MPAKRGNKKGGIAKGKKKRKAQEIPVAAEESAAHSTDLETSTVSNLGTTLDLNDSILL